MPVIAIAVVVSWLLVAAVVVGYPIVTGRIRMGAKGSPPITREDDPAAFWRAYALSTLLFVVVSAVLAIFVLPRLP